MKPRLLQIKESATIKMTDRAREIVNVGIHVVKLQTGDPDFDTPTKMIVLNSPRNALVSF